MEAIYPIPAGNRIKRVDELDTARYQISLALIKL